MHPWESITTQLGLHFEKSNDGQPPAPGIAVVGPGVPEPPEGAGVVALKTIHGALWSKDSRKSNTPANLL